MPASLFKRAAARGVAHALARQNLVFFPSKEAMDEAADAVADGMPDAGPAGGGGMPEISGPEGHSPEDVAAIGNKLIEIGNALLAEAHSGAGGAPGGEMPPEVAGGVMEAKQASARDYETLAFEAADFVMQKAAEETQKLANPQGALIHGGDKQNTPGAAASNDSVAALDEKQRPQGAYQVAVGDTAFDTRKGHIGALENHDKKPSNSPSGSNSLTQDAGKTAAISARIREMLKQSNALIHGGDHQNTPAAAAQHDTVAALDQKQRPQGYAVVGQGNTNIKEEAAARIGKEQPHPNAPTNHPGGSNSVISASKTGGDLSEDERVYAQLFDKTAADVGAYLPKNLSTEQKIAAIQQMIPMSRDQRQEGLNQLHKQAGALHDIVKSMGAVGHEESKKKDEKKDDEKKDDEKKDDEKKEGSLLSHIREIANRSAG